MQADEQLGRFVRQQISEFERIGYPTQAAFAKLVAAGTVKVTPPEDPQVEAVGRFFWRRNDVQRRIMVDRYCPGSPYEKAKRASMSVRRWQIEMDRLLTALSGYLEARAI